MGVEGLDGWREAARERIGSRSGEARILEDLNARSNVRDGGCISRRFRGLEICYVTSDYHSLVNMKKEFLTRSLKRVDHGWRRRVGVFLADTPCPRERAAGSWGLR